MVSEALRDRVIGLPVSVWIKICITNQGFFFIIRLGCLYVVSVWIPRLFVKLGGFVDDCLCAVNGEVVGKGKDKAIRGSCIDV